MRHLGEHLAHGTCSDLATSVVLVHRAKGEQKKLETPRKSQSFQQGGGRSTQRMPASSVHKTVATLRWRDAGPPRSHNRAGEGGGGGEGAKPSSLLTGSPRSTFRLLRKLEANPRETAETPRDCLRGREQGLQWSRAQRLSGRPHRPGLEGSCSNKIRFGDQLPSGGGQACWGQELLHLREVRVGRPDLSEPRTPPMRRARGLGIPGSARLAAAPGTWSVHASRGCHAPGPLGVAGAGGSGGISPALDRGQTPGPARPRPAGPASWCALRRCKRVLPEAELPRERKPETAQKPGMPRGAPDQPLWASAHSAPRSRGG